ncbi:MAG: polymer-forming cytoskeletal protein [Gammaproteobacteria bacterium]|nr:polymer-forming cytoskeletal protein [Gammaproteobacteria bacterium]
MDLQHFLKRGRGKGRRTLDGVQQITTLIGHDNRFVGRLEGAGNTIVNGTFEGDCDIEGVLVLSEQGCWTGNIGAGTAIVSGEVRGDITVKDKLELTATARVTGRISAPVLAIEEGAIHQGEIRMGREIEVHRFRERRQDDAPAAG